MTPGKSEILAHWIEDIGIARHGERAFATMTWREVMNDQGDGMR